MLSNHLMSFFGVCWQGCWVSLGGWRFLVGNKGKQWCFVCCLFYFMWRWPLFSLAWLCVFARSFVGSCIVGYF